MKTECRKCGALMTDQELVADRFITTAYLCRGCGHWNDLKRRNGFREWKNTNQPQRKIA